MRTMTKLREWSVGESIINVSIKDGDRRKIVDLVLEQLKQMLPPEAVTLSIDIDIDYSIPLNLVNSPKMLQYMYDVQTVFKKE